MFLDLQMRHWKWLGLSLLWCGSFVLLMGCDPKNEPPGNKPPERRPPTRKPPVNKPQERIIPSQKARLTFKGGHRLVNTLSKGLSLKKDEVCKELGKFDCARDAHLIVLGGVEPYRLAVRAPWKDVPLIAPIAMDRLALSVCGNRVKKDFADAKKAAVFGPVIGKKEADKKAMETVITSLYKRLMLRLPNAKEVELLSGFWENVKKKKSKQPAQDWSTLVCYGLVTSTEFLFY